MPRQCTHWLAMTTTGSLYGVGSSSSFRLPRVVIARAKPVAIRFLWQYRYGQQCLQREVGDDLPYGVYEGACRRSHRAPPMRGGTMALGTPSFPVAIFPDFWYTNLKITDWTVLL